MDGYQRKLRRIPLPEAVSVYSCKQQLPENSFIADFEYAKLENGMRLFKKNKYVLLITYINKTGVS